VRRVARMQSPDTTHETVGAHDVLAGVIAGLVGGAVGAWAMNQVGPGIQYVKQAWRGVGDGGDAADERRSGEQRASHDEEDSATLRVARAVSRTAVGHDLPEGSESAAANAVHFGFGAVNGGWYGAMAEVWPMITGARGMLFGTLVWAGADEVAMPALGLSASPARYPLSTHAESLATHLVYGVATDTVRRLVRRALS
jgi:putative membrane protein